LVLEETELFQYLKDNKWPDLVKSEGTYDTFDCISEESGVYAELKSRRTHYDDLLIEKIKWDNLVLHADTLQLCPWYINATPQGIYAFDLSKMPMPEWSERLMPATTDFGNRQKIGKIVGFLSISEAMTLADLSV